MTIVAGLNMSACWLMLQQLGFYDPVSDPKFHPPTVPAGTLRRWISDDSFALLDSHNALSLAWTVDMKSMRDQASDHLVGKGFQDVERAKAIWKRVVMRQYSVAYYNRFGVQPSAG